MRKVPVTRDSYAHKMIDESFPHTIEGIRAFAGRATAWGDAVAQFALTTAYFTPIYREPGIESIDTIDAEVGSEIDVEGPLEIARIGHESRAAGGSCIPSVDGPCSTDQTADDDDRAS